nr:hypothetical protein BaRGS_022210 [Batillaria attramentaria]
MGHRSFGLAGVDSIRLQPDGMSPDVLGDLGHNKISYIDVDMDTERLNSPAVYADPQGSANHSLRSGSGVSPYSSVPVPLPPGAPELRSTFATIHRTPSVPAVSNKGGYARPITQQGGEVIKTRRKDGGYFANGRYYDPNPMPQTEVYAPASSYSDRSTAPLSTFIPDRPRSRSLSSSEPSSDGELVDGEGEGSEGELDLFPFDPKDATEPVEV